MPLAFADPTPDAIPVDVVTPDRLDAVMDALTENERNWVSSQGFTAALGQCVLLGGANGRLARVLAGFGSDKARARGRFHMAIIASKLPKGVYQIASGLEGDALVEAALAWLLTGYKYTRYSGPPSDGAALVAPDGIDADRIEVIANGEALTRELINTPASDMGPDELEHATRALANEHDASLKVVVGDDLIPANFPMIHTVGRASTRAPRLIDMRWGDRGPQLTLVGKGVCFDTGGLNLKPGGSMGLMKKDMGGAANVLGLAHMIMALEMPLRLRVLIPAVENSVSGNAFRPQDILTSRKGLTVEINNTDAEGRLVLADALTLSDEDEPDLVISMATLTGAARVAVGPDLSPFYTDSDDHAAALSTAAAKVADPVWRMPFHDPYEDMIEPGIADLDNAPSGGMAGSITAALFLRRFVESPYMHFDIYGWQPSPKPARPKGGVGMGARAVLEALPSLLKL